MSICCKFSEYHIQLENDKIRKQLHTITPKNSLFFILLLEFLIYILTNNFANKMSDIKLGNQVFRYTFDLNYNGYVCCG